MKDILVFIISWNRLNFLKQTLDSLYKQLSCLKYDIFIVDNNSDLSVKDFIKSGENGYRLLDSNKGINWPIENILPEIVNHEYVCISDHDIYYARHFSTYIDFLDNNPDFAVAKGIESPEHPTKGKFLWNNETWLIKMNERGGGIVTPTEILLKSFPLPKRKIDFDDYYMKYVGRIKKKIAVLPKGAVHLGWKANSSTWQNKPLPEKYILVNDKVVNKQEFKHKML